jgi:hypothetical protein
MAATASLLSERETSDPEQLAESEQTGGEYEDGGYLEMTIEETEPPRRKAAWQTTTATIISNSTFFHCHVVCILQVEEEGEPPLVQPLPFA